MTNIIPPSPSYGQIEYPLGERSETFDISKAEISLETIEKDNFLYVSVTASHHELHGGAKVYILDVDLFLVIPVSFNHLNDNQLIDLPEVDSCHPNWEKTVYSVFYRFEHLIVLNGSISIEAKDKSYMVLLEGEVGEGLESNHKFPFQAEFQADLKDKIDRDKIWFLP
jgi:hypothetical protein